MALAKAFGTSGSGMVDGFARLRQTSRVALALLVLVLAGVGQASAETRSLKLYFTHTGEKAEIVFKRNGKYDSAGLTKINRLLRDWRRNEPTKMDPKLMDLMWEVYRQSGSRQYIHVISAYRSPATNSMLQRTRGGQATKSQHMYGRAIDFFLPDVKLSKLRDIGLKLGVGGVGYYPTSGSPFVHLDTGSVRHWPRMSRSELVRVFPNGGTLHVPSDGKPLPGYETAMANYKSRQASGNLVPSSGSSSRSTASASDSGGKKPTLLGVLFGGGADEEEDNAESTAVASSPAPRPAAPVNTVVASVQEQRLDATAPQVSAPAPVQAELPTTNIPVPTPAPRIAAPAPEIVPEPDPVVPDAVDPLTPPDATEPVLVAEAVPTPSPRPAFEAAPDLGGTQVAGLEADPSNALREALQVPETTRPETDAIVTALAPVTPAPRPDAPAINTAAFPPTPDGKTGRLAAPSARPEPVRPVVAAAPAAIPAESGPIGTGVRTGVVTTAKAAKPRLIPTDAFNVAPLPATSDRFGPDSARSALTAPADTRVAGQLQRDIPARDPRRLTGQAIDFSTTGTVAN